MTLLISESSTPNNVPSKDEGAEGTQRCCVKLYIGHYVTSHIQVPASRRRGWPEVLNAVLNAELFVTTTPMCDPHSLTPPHTPQLSSAAEAQHVPPGERGTSQQTPFTSTATPVPLHTPQPSSTPSQHCPLDDRVAVGEQHFPVVLSIKPVQHTPDVSTTPVQASRVDWIEIREHEGPIQPVLHSHTCRALLHIQCPTGAGQSAVVLHPHDTSVSHCAIDTGSSPATQHTGVWHWKPSEIHTSHTA